MTHLNVLRPLRMKRVFLSVLVLILSGAVLRAQTYMHICKTDGTIEQIATDELDSITYTLDAPPDLLNLFWVDGGLSSVPIAEIDSIYHTTVAHTIPLGESLVVNVRGQVVDELGAPIAGAAVTPVYGGIGTLTDASGSFALNSVTAYELQGHISITKTGYFDASRSFIPTEGDGIVYVTMLSKETVGTVPAEAGGTIAVAGAQITMGVGFSRNGEAYTGVVHVSLAHLDPTQASFEAEMPGNLLGADAGERVSLASYGVMFVELFDEVGMPLEMAEGNHAELKFPVAEEQLTEAPQTIPLWYFDDDLGYWIREGEAVLVNGSYVGEVSHFTPWNCDIVIPSVRIQGQVFISEGASSFPAVGEFVRISANDGAFRTTLVTNSSGFFGGFVLENVALSMSVELSCGVTFVQDIGPFASGPVTLPTTFINNIALTVVTGTVVDCNGIPVGDDGCLLVNGRSHFLYPDGTFAYATCAPEATFRAFHDGKASLVYYLELNGGALLLGEVQTCIEVAGFVQDVEGNLYPTVIIGEDDWMAANLRTSSFSNGDALAQPMDVFTVWDDANTENTEPWWGYVNNDSINSETYGNWYNAYAVLDPRNVCPTGWHVPTHEEWTAMIDFIGGSTGAAPKLKVPGWFEDGTGPWKRYNGQLGTALEGTNESGFSALPSVFAGLSYGTGGDYDPLNAAVWWNSTQGGANDLGSAWMGHQSNDFESQPAGIGYNAGLAIRCVRD